MVLNPLPIISFNFLSLHSRIKSLLLIELSCKWHPFFPTFFFFNYWISSKHRLHLMYSVSLLPPASAPNTAEQLFPKVSVTPLTGKPEANRVLQKLIRIPLIDALSAIISHAFYTPVPLLLLLLWCFSMSTLGCISHMLFDKLPSVSAWKIQTLPDSIYNCWMNVQCILTAG